MDALAALSVDTSALLSRFLSSQPVALLLLGALLGIMVTFASKALMLSVGALWRVATTLMKSLVAVFWTAFVLSKDCLTRTLTWKTYKKVMPWRNVALAGDAGTEIGEASSDPRSTSKRRPNWYGKEEDVAFFCDRVIDQEQLTWKCICQNDFNDFLRYTAYCRILPGNKTEYKSVTIVKDATAEEMTNFYLDDDCRVRWDGMLSKAELLEEGSVKDRCQVVRWIRSFPFPFLSNREYIIGRRIFRKNGVIYTVSRGIGHPAAPARPSVVRMDVFYSMWSCRDVACPWGTDRTACEVVLLHHEQFKIPEKLARFAACKGMWGFIKSMAPAIAQYIQVQRSSDSGSSFSSSVRHSNSELSFMSDASSSATTSLSRSDKPNKVARTVRRALVAAALTAAVVVGRSYTYNTGRRQN